MNFILTCGGTAGHINPALSIADSLRRVIPDARILFIGSGRTLEKKLIPGAGYDLRNIKMSGFLRGVSPSKLVYNLKTVKNLVFAGGEAGKILGGFRPDAVIGTGGYICYPVLKKAAGMGIPTLIHESNAVPGLTAKMLSAHVKKVLVSFRGVENQYRRPERVEFTGTPVRGEFDALSKESERRRLGLDSRPLVVSFWGSLGAERMNEAMAGFIKRNTVSGLFNHIHATGGGDAGLNAMLERLGTLGMPRKLPGGVDIRAYIDDMPSVMAAADVVLCRAGASTIAELTLMGKPAVLVPSPYVPNNHQEHNARQLENAGGAEMLLEKDCTGDVLYETVAELVRNRIKLSEMSAAQKKLAAPGAAERIAEMILSMC